MVDMHAEQEGRMGQLRVVLQAERGQECPEESEWPRVAAGMKQGVEAETLLRHAAECDHCGPLLHQYAEDFAEDLTVEEETALAGLKSFQPGWQERLAAKVCNPRQSRSIGAWLRERLLPAPGLPRLAYGAGLAAILCALIFIPSRQRPVEDLLATAYTEQRTLELRIPKAAYAPVRLVRGSGDRSRLDRPPALLEVEARIARELEKEPASSGLLQAMGRTNLLAWDYDAAIGSLERALKLEPVAPSLLTDLASGYFERAEANRSEADYRTAADLLSRALKAAPDDPIALFNRAIVYERMHLNDQSIADWQRYLRVDTGSSWTPEARKRLADVQRIKTP
jgi:tetratricopeptide (TPR) repeat protein